MSYIKKLRTSMLVAAATVAAASNASVNPTDSLSLRWMDDDSLTVSMKLDAGGQKIRRNTRVIVTPKLVGEDGNSKSLPAIEFATRRNRKYNDRIVAFEKGTRNNVYATDATVAYNQTVEVEEWMLNTPLTLQIVREKEGCCNVDLLSQDNVGSTEYVSPFVPAAVPVAPRKSVAETMSESEPVLAPMESYAPFNREIPLAKMKGALYVHFPMNKSKIDYDYRENRATLERITNIMERISADTASAVVKVRIVGLSSPEGPAKFNERLALERAEALRDYLAEKVDLPADAYEVIGAGEAWPDLEYSIENSDLENKEDLLRILKEVDNEVEREKLVRKFNGGAAFEYLKQQVFVDQRNAGYIQVYYEAAPDKDAEAINKAVTLVKEEKYDEAVKLLENLDDDRKYNTLGVAYFMLGRKAEAAECFKKAASEGDKDAENNLKGMR